MTDTSGPTSGTPFAQYDPGSSYWRTSEATSLWALTLSSLTLPPWGCLRGGELFERPTPEPLTTGSASSSLPTPVADNSRGLPNGGDYQSLPNAVLRLPTPRAQNGEPRNQTIYERPPDQPQNLENALAMLPTPQAGDGFGQNDNLNNSRAHKESPYSDLPRTVAKELLGALTLQQSDAGSQSQDDPRQPPLFSETGEIV